MKGAQQLGEGAEKLAAGTAQLSEGASTLSGKLKEAEQGSAAAVKGA
ncbi:hypothetical protein, partial [Deinococcus wulumuqiensis]